MRLTGLLFVAGCSIYLGDAEDVVCTKQMKKVVTINEGDSFSFKTQSGDKYEAGTKCTVKYKKNISCPAIRFSCSEFDLINKNTKCNKGDKMFVIADGEKEKFCQGSSPDVTTTSKTMKVVFKADKKMQGSGALCTAECISDETTPSTSLSPTPSTTPASTPVTNPTGTTGPSTQCSSERYDFGEVLRLSNLFYEAQRSGKLPDNNRVPWRGDSSLGDVGNNGEDLTGGYHDAGDYVKFGLPMASAMTVLAYGGISYEDAYKDAGQYAALQDTVKWGTDYLIKAHVSPNKFYCQVGNGIIDHEYPGRPETMTVNRPAYLLKPSKPGSDCAGESAASLASAAVLFKDTDQAYSATLIQHAKELFSFADTYRGKYSSSISDAFEFYKSSSYEDELIWASAWLYKATGDNAYLTKAEDMYAARSATWTPWAFDWDDKLAGAQLLLFELTGKQKYKSDVESFCDDAMDIEKSPKGQTFRLKWGSNRYASNFAFICLGAAHAGIKTDTYAEYADQQIGYMLGDSGRSFVVGFGQNFPKQPHHKAAACASLPALCAWETFYDTNKDNPHQLNGALVGGPTAPNDVYKDDRTDYTMAEVTLDYNAGFQSAVAGLKALACNSSPGSVPGPTPAPSPVPAPAPVPSPAPAPTGGSAGSCDSLVVNQNGWTENLQGTLKIVLASDITTFTITMETDIPLTNIVFWTADVTPTSGNIFTLTSKDWFEGKQTGDILELGFQMTFAGDTNPRITSITLNDSSLC